MRNFYWRTFLLSFVLILTKITCGQKIIRSTLSSFGSTYVDGSFLIRQTVGQPSNTDVISDETGYTLRQGFQQPVEALNNKNKKCEILVYPNPNRGEFKIALDKSYEEAEMNVYNSNGSTILQQLIYEGKTAVYLPTTNTGIYFIYVKTNENFVCRQKLLIID